MRHYITVLFECPVRKYPMCTLLSLYCIFQYLFCFFKTLDLTVGFLRQNVKLNLQI